MRSFTDGTGKRWHVRLDIAAAMRIEGLTENRLGRSTIEAWLQEIADKPAAFGAVMFDVVQPDCQPEEFAAILSDCIAEAFEALSCEALDFFLDARRSGGQAAKHSSEIKTSTLMMILGLSGQLSSGQQEKPALSPGDTASAS